MTPEELAVLFKRRGDFDDTRKNMLRDFQNSPVGLDFSEQLSNILHATTEEDPTLLQKDRSSFHQAMVDRISKSEEYKKVEQFVHSLLEPSQYMGKIEGVLMTLVQENAPAKMEKVEKLETPKLEKSKGSLTPSVTSKGKGSEKHSANGQSAKGLGLSEWPSSSSSKDLPIIVSRRDSSEQSSKSNSLSSKVKSTNSNSIPLGKDDKISKFANKAQASSSKASPSIPHEIPKGAESLSSSALDVDTQSDTAMDIETSDIKDAETPIISADAKPTVDEQNKAKPTNEAKADCKTESKGESKQEANDMVLETMSGTSTPKKAPSITSGKSGLGSRKSSSRKRNRRQSMDSNSSLSSPPSSSEPESDGDGLCQDSLELIKGESEAMETDDTLEDKNSRTLEKNKNTNANGRAPKPENDTSASTSGSMDVDEKEGVKADSDVQTKVSATEEVDITTSPRSESAKSIPPKPTAPLSISSRLSSPTSNSIKLGDRETRLPETLSSLTSSTVKSSPSNKHKPVPLPPRPKVVPLPPKPVLRGMQSPGGSHQKHQRHSSGSGSGLGLGLGLSPASGVKIITGSLPGTSSAGGNITPTASASPSLTSSPSTARGHSHGHAVHNPVPLPPKPAVIAHRRSGSITAPSSVSLGVKVVTSPSSLIPPIPEISKDGQAKELTKLRTDTEELKVESDTPNAKMTMPEALPKVLTSTPSSGLIDVSPNSANSNASSTLSAALSSPTSVSSSTPTSATASSTADTSSATDPKSTASNQPIIAATATTTSVTSTRTSAASTTIATAGVAAKTETSTTSSSSSTASSSLLSRAPIPLPPKPKAIPLPPRPPTSFVNNSSGHHNKKRKY